MRHLSRLLPPEVAPTAGQYVLNLLVPAHPDQPLRVLRLPLRQPLPRNPSLDEVWLACFDLYLSQRLADRQLSIARLSEAFAMSEATLLRRVRRLTGRSPQQYLLGLRMHRAWQLLHEQPRLSIAQVAAATGYPAGSFSRRFKAYFGCMPTALRS